MKTFIIAAVAVAAFAETAAAGALPPPPPATGPVYEIVVVARKADTVTPRYQANLDQNLSAMDDRLNRDILRATDETNAIRLADLFGDEEGETMIDRVGR